MSEKTKVIFRKFNQGGDVIALFPELPGDMCPGNCLAYQHWGQHGTASVDIIDISRLATPDEYADLKNELEKLVGYDLVVYHRFTYKDYRKRRNAIRLRA